MQRIFLKRLDPERHRRMGHIQIWSVTITYRSSPGYYPHPTLHIDTDLLLEPNPAPNITCNHPISHPTPIYAHITSTSRYIARWYRGTWVQTDVSPPPTTMIGHYDNIPPYIIGGVKKDEIKMMCTGKGLITWYYIEGTRNMAECLYFANCDRTVIKPTNIVEWNKDRYKVFTIESNYEYGTGHLILRNRDGITHGTYPMTWRNGL